MKRSRRPGSVSIEFRLPILITALLLGIIAAIVAASYAEVHSAAVQSAENKAQTVATTLSSSIEPNMQRRLAVLKQVAADPAVVGFLAGRAGDVETVRNRLALLRAQPDTMLPVQLWSTDRRPVLDAAQPLATGPEPEWAAAWSPAAMPRSDSASYGPFIVGPGRHFFWTVAPVRENDRLLGWVAQLRAVQGSGPTIDNLQQLAGSGLLIRLGSDPGEHWITAQGEAVPRPSNWPFTGPLFYRDDAGEGWYAHSQPIPGSDLFVIAQVPHSVVIARPHAFLRGVGAVALVVILIGGMIAWLLSRSVTDPLKRLRSAAQALAEGRYGERVRLRRGDEIGSLATAFNHMAEQVQSAHGELERQFAGATTLAGELERANAQLRDAMAVAESLRVEAQKASRAKSEFLATMSHEIRTPINAMLGYADILELGVVGPLTDKQREQLARIRASGRHLVGLIEEVLDLAGIESGQFRLQNRVASIADAIETALAILGPQALAKNISIERGCECLEPSLYRGDPQRVEQIIVNLLSNAVKFTPSGGRVHIRCSTRKRNGEEWCEATVEDSGAGIAADQIERIFEPFVQGDTGYTRVHGGVGLGLAISRRLARMMGGDVVVASNPGDGSRFTFRVPRARSTSAVQDSEPAFR